MSDKYLEFNVPELEDAIHTTAIQIQKLERYKTKLLNQVKERILFDIERRAG